MNAYGSNRLCYPSIDENMPPRFLIGDVAAETLPHKIGSKL